jgi:hypothetical protein
MTPEEHNKTLGICHLAYGGFTTLLMLAACVFMWVVLGAIPARPGAPETGMPAAILGMMLTFMVLYTLVFTLPSFIAGYAMLKRKSWARVVSLVAAVFETMSFPFGTAVAVYSFWFMFSDAGKALYDVPPTARADFAARPYALHDAPPPPASEWDAMGSRERERSYTPPEQPPDWRG